MAKVVETDEQVKLSEQLDEDVGPVILINKFNGKKTLLILRVSLDSFPLSSIEELAVAVYSSTMLFGNLLRCSRWHLAKLTCRNYYRIIPPAQ